MGVAFPSCLVDMWDRGALKINLPSDIDLHLGARFYGSDSSACPRCLLAAYAAGTHYARSEEINVDGTKLTAAWQADAFRVNAVFDGAVAAARAAASLRGGHQQAQ